jgi:hypothetical protein
MDRPEEAKRHADLILADLLLKQPPEYRLILPAFAAAGRTEEALALVAKDLQANGKFTQSMDEGMAVMIQALAWMGRPEEAERALALLPAAPASAERRASTRAAIWLWAEQGDIERVRRGLEAFPGAQRDALIVSLFWRLIQKELPGKAAQAALLSDSSLVRARLFLKLAARPGGFSTGLHQRLFLGQSLRESLASQDRIGLEALTALLPAAEGTPLSGERLKQIGAAVRWMELAHYFMKSPAIGRTGDYFESLKAKDFDAVPYDVAAAALEWARASVYIKANE